MRKLVQLGRDDQRQEEQDRNADGERAVCPRVAGNVHSCRRFSHNGAALDGAAGAAVRHMDLKGGRTRMRKNKTKAKLAANECAIGVSVAFPSPDLVELCAVVGFDFVTFDTEHEPMDGEQVVHCIRAAEAYDMTPIVRLPRNPDLILRYMNAGAQGIHVPRCNTAADLQALVKWTRFHPLGERTFYNRGR